MQRVIVVGAGIIGLSCAVRLLEEGHEVHVLARDLPAETTSAVSAALWYPYRAAPAERVNRWGRRTFTSFTRLAASGDVTGVRMRPGTELLREHGEQPEWSGDVEGYETLTEVPEPYVSGRRFTTAIADMTVYLPWLRERVYELGGTLTRVALERLPMPAAGVVVDTAGLGARLLAADPTVRPLRGQVVVVEQFGLTRWSLDGMYPTYVVPRERTVVVGGSADADEWSTRPDADLARRLLDRAYELLLRTGEPAMADRLRRSHVVAHRVGLRPERPTVRVEEQRIDGTRVVHCYGHGGSGMTLSWGCAEEVLEIVRGG